MLGRRRSRERFLCWYRLLPLAVLALTLAVCGILAAAPTTLGRQFLYPVHDPELIEGAAERHGVDPRLACAVIKCESGWDADAVSDAGAIGLMQVMPSTAESLVSLGLVDAGAYPPDELADPEVNVEYGCAYLAFLEKNLSSLDEIVAAYNAGIGSVQGWIAEGGTIPEGIEYAETRVYLERVRLAYEGYQASYPSGSLT